MRIQGFIGTTFIDFPGRIASAVFTSGCNFRCPFCHNPTLVVPRPDSVDISCSQVLARIRQREGFIDGVVISGGEPLIQTGILDFLTQLRPLNVQVKLDTNGSMPDILHEILAAGLVDFISMDVKAVPAKYSLAAGVHVDWNVMETSIRMIIESGVEHEFRTTVVPGFVALEEIPVIAGHIAGARQFAIQQFRPGITLDPEMQTLSPFPLHALKLWGDRAKENVLRVEVRGS